MPKTKANKQVRLTPKERSTITLWMDKNKEFCLSKSKFEKIQEEIKAKLNINATIGAISDIASSLDIKLSSRNVPPPNFWSEIQKLKDNDENIKTKQEKMDEVLKALCEEFSKKGN